MTKDYVMWDIDELVKSYVNYPDIAQSVTTTMEKLFAFMEAKGLLVCPVTNEYGKVIKRKIMYNEITEEGVKLSSGPKNPVHRWLGSKGAQKTPPDMKMLEKALTEIRNSKAEPCFSHISASVANIADPKRRK